MASTAAAISHAAMLVISVFLKARPMTASLDVSMSSCTAAHHIVSEGDVKIAAQVPACNQSESRLHLSSILLSRFWFMMTSVQQVKAAMDGNIVR